ncbi:MAG: VCBS repeat-containing protein [Paraglaciecola sp.]|nr:VCBS repeat-containing protein [Paraglaciecola sp.]NCT47627.1 VCBS repeat-containing protein [Paraglaciecola sp.]
MSFVGSTLGLHAGRWLCLASFVFVRTMLLSVLLVSAAHGAKTDLFSQYDIVLPFNVTHPVMAANLLPGNGKELLILGVTESGQRAMAIYQFDQGKDRMQLMDAMPLANDLFAVDLGDVDQNGLQHVYFVAKDQIYRYQYKEAAQPYGGPVLIASDAGPAVATQQLLNASSSALQPFVNVQTMYLSTSAAALTDIDFAKDINHDKQDDFVIAGFETVNVYLSGQAERRTTSLPIASLLSIKGQEVGFTPQQLNYVDLNQDNKTDIVLVESGRLLVYAQDESGNFNATPHIIEIAQGIEGIDWWDKVEADGQSLDQSQLFYQRLETISDINGDTLPDLVVRVTKSAGVLDRKNDYTFYFARLMDDKLHYAVQPDTVIQSDSTLSEFSLLDLNNDGKQEVMLSAFDLGLSQIISALLSSSIEQQVVLYQMDEQQRYGEKPATSQDVEITFSLSSGRSGEPMVKGQDVNGDGLKDLIFSEGEEQIKVLFAQANAKRMFVKRAEKFKVQVPKNAKYISHHDINADGKMDLLLHYSRADEAKLLNKIVVLVAN